jgi:16S rRNA A1518/A1519 N6-dimethyltransferase RsmA/KsgA/DIM1 with predicted DNA glycosylase/AP lyase activity
MLTSLLLKGFDWKGLKENALVVDVGGGVGSTTLQLLKAYPHLRYIVQDRPHVIADGIKVRASVKENQFKNFNYHSNHTVLGA